MLDGYVAAVAECDAESVALACQRINSGQSGLNTSYPPTPADIAWRASLLTPRPTPKLLNGLIEMDWGHGRVDMRGLTTEEQEVIIAGGGKIDGKNAALLDLDGKRAAIAAAAKSLPPPKRARVPIATLEPWNDPTGWVEWSPDMGSSPPIAVETRVWVKVAGAGLPRVFSEDSRPRSAFAWDSRNPDIRIIAYKVDRRGQNA